MVQSADENEVKLKVAAKKNSSKFQVTWPSGLMLNKLSNKLLGLSKTMKVGSITAYYCKSELELKEIKVQFTTDANKWMEVSLVAERVVWRRTTRSTTKNFILKKIYILALTTSFFRTN